MRLEADRQELRLEIAGEVGEGVDVHVAMGVDEADSHLHHTIACT